MTTTAAAAKRAGKQLTCHDAVKEHSLPEPALVLLAIAPVPHALALSHQERLVPAAAAAAAGQRRTSGQQSPAGSPTTTFWLWLGLLVVVAVVAVVPAVAVVAVVALVVMVVMMRRLCSSGAG